MVRDTVTRHISKGRVISPTPLVLKEGGKQESCQSLQPRHARFGYRNAGKTELYSSLPCFAIYPRKESRTCQRNFSYRARRISVVSENHQWNRDRSRTSKR